MDFFDGLAHAVIIGGFIGMTGSVAGFVFASRRDPLALLRTRPPGLLSIGTNRTQEEVVGLVTRYALMHGLILHHAST